MKTKSQDFEPRLNPEQVRSAAAANREAAQISNSNRTSIVINKDLEDEAKKSTFYLDEENGKIVREIYSDIKRKTDAIADIHSLLQAARVKIEAFKYLSDALIAAWIVKILGLKVIGVADEIKSKALHSPLRRSPSRTPVKKDNDLEAKIQAIRSKTENQVQIMPTEVIQSLWARIDSKIESNVTNFINKHKAEIGLARAIDANSISTNEDDLVALLMQGSMNADENRDHYLHTILSTKLDSPLGTLLRETAVFNFALSVLGLRPKLNLGNDDPLVTTALSLAAQKNLETKQQENKKREAQEQFEMKQRAIQAAGKITESEQRAATPITTSIEEIKPKVEPAPKVEVESSARSEINITELNREMIDILFQEKKVSVTNFFLRKQKVTGILMHYIFGAMYKSPSSLKYKINEVIGKLSDTSADIKAIKSNFFDYYPLQRFKGLLEDALVAHLYIQDSRNISSIDSTKVDLFWTNLFNLAESIKRDLQASLREGKTIPKKGESHALTFPEVVNNSYKHSGKKAELRRERKKRYILNTLFPPHQINNVLNKRFQANLNCQAVITELCSTTCNIDNLIQKYPALKSQSIKAIDLLLEIALDKVSSDQSFKVSVETFWENLKNLVNKVRENQVANKLLKPDLFDNVAPEELFKIALEQFENNNNTSHKMFQDLTKRVMFKISQPTFEKLQYHTLSTNLNLASLELLLGTLCNAQCCLEDLKRQCSKISLVALSKDLTYYALFLAICGQNSLAKDLRKPLFWTNLLQLIHESGGLLTSAA